MVVTNSSSSSSITATAADNNSNNDTSSLFFDRKVELASEGLTSRYSTCFYKIPLRENALTLANYIISMKSEQDIYH
jgi:hypothetical protein